jgi:hypothetical protein
MKRKEFEHFSRLLQQRLQREEQVFALIALGSMAEPQRADEWSDHDFWVVAASGKAEELLADLSWLPHAEQILVPIRQAPCYYTVLYADGHVAEFAIFTPETMLNGKLSAYRVLFDRLGLSRNLQQITCQSQAHPSESRALALMHNFLVTLLTGAGRAGRGEMLSSDKYTIYLAVDLLLELFRQYIPTEQPALVDPLDAWRRCEIIYPELTGELRMILHLPMPARALQLLELADQQLCTRMPNYPRTAVEIVRRKLGAPFNS